MVLLGVILVALAVLGFLTAFARGAAGSSSTRAPPLPSAVTLRAIAASPDLRARRSFD